MKEIVPFRIEVGNILSGYFDWVAFVLAVAVTISFRHSKQNNLHRIFGNFTELHY